MSDDLEIAVAPSDDAEEEAAMIDLDPREVAMRCWDGEREMPAL